jgi:hypothetical protein
MIGVRAGKTQRPTVWPADNFDSIGIADRFRGGVFHNRNLISRE